MEFLIDRFNPEVDEKPHVQRFVLEDCDIGGDMMLLGALEKLREQDPTLTFRSSCKEGVCGSDGMNVNGQNRLSCITRVSELTSPVVIKPLPGLPVIKDLVIDMELFYQHYRDVKPYLQPAPKDLDHEILQTPEEREKLDGSYECILCGCCSTSCPSFWWNPDKFHGPAALLAAHRFVVDSRDITTRDRLEALDDPYKTFRCRNIQNCTASCPKGLNPSRAINELKSMMLAKQLD
ncbi:succinate dehydrogenase iron-sulfur subunit [Hydrogenovibrio marinus]|uniref:Succinate dehydrogenase iron-sulfur subunit n=1 Tax=Hydrogenovibrio marinus TaxID=28885 RepID=A0A067A1L5_HYDMR|nr:succinate dehydrogenase iron-sulfur subunit [Hydrogenovibrio marinus]KDN96215.1 succinate dehydrogenase [Hydrogenovibrio marinus]BBN60607.1 succinate dehydrogenase iron-sulfur subunit [Hydrogenovibrio marinus]